MVPQRINRKLFVGLALAAIVIAAVGYAALAWNKDTLPLSALECDGRGVAVIVVPNATRPAGESVRATTYLHNPTDEPLPVPNRGEFTAYRVEDGEKLRLMGAGGLTQDYAEWPDPVPPGGVELFSGDFPVWNASQEDGSPAPPGLYLYHVQLDVGGTTWCGHTSFVLE